MQLPDTIIIELVVSHVYCMHELEGDFEQVRYSTNHNRSVAALKFWSYCCVSLSGISCQP